MRRHDDFQLNNTPRLSLAWLDGAGGRVDVMGDSSDTAQVHPREFTEMAISQSGATVRLNSKVIGVETVPEEGGGRKVTGVKVRGKTTFERLCFFRGQR